MYVAKFDGIGALFTYDSILVGVCDSSSHRFERTVCAAGPIPGYCQSNFFRRENG